MLANSTSKLINMQYYWGVLLPKRSTLGLYLGWDRAASSLHCTSPTMSIVLSMDDTIGSIGLGQGVLIFLPLWLVVFHWNRQIQTLFLWPPERVQCWVQELTRGRLCWWCYIVWNNYRGRWWLIFVQLAPRNRDGDCRTISRTLSVQF